MGTLGRLAAILYKGDNFVFFVRVPVHQTASEKESTQKGKNLLPRGANSFLFEQTPFQKGIKEVLKELPPLKAYRFPLSHVY